MPRLDHERHQKGREGRKAVQQQGGRGNTDSNGELHDRGKQGVSAAGVCIGEVNQRQGVHAGELNGVGPAQQREHAQENKFMGSGAYKVEGGQQRSYGEGIDDHNVPVTKFPEQTRRNRFCQQIAQGQRNQGHAGLKSGITKHHLEEKRHQVRQAASAQAADDVAGDSDGKVSDAEQGRAEDGGF